LSLKKIRAVIFDLDETLIDVTESLSMAQEAVANELEKYLKDNGFKINLEKIQNKIKFVDDLMNMLLKYDRNDWWQYLVDQLGIDYKLNSEFKRKLTDVYWNFYIGSIKLYEDSIPTLEYLKGKGYSLGMITDTDGEPGKKKARIDNLEQKRLKKTDYLCKLCGNRIDRMFTIIYKLYFKERYNIDIPLICCNCYDSLKRNEFVSRSKWKIYLILSSIFSTIFFLVYFLTFGLIFSSGFSTTLVFLLIGIILWVIIVIKDLVRLKKVVSGRKYYKRYFINKYYKSKNKK